MKLARMLVPVSIRPLELTMTLVVLALAVAPAGAAVGSWSTSGPDGGPIQALAIDPTASNVLYVGTGGGVFTSTNSGSTWSNVSTGLDDSDVRAIAIDPSSSSTLYAGTGAGGVFKSTDSGSTWSSANTGLSNLDVRAIAIDSTTSSIYAGTADGVYKSTNGGTSWSLQLSQPEVTSLAVDPTTTSILYAGTTGSGVLKSINSGSSWTSASTGLANMDIRDLAINPSTTSTLYAATEGGGVFRSSNSAGSWSGISTGLGDFDVRALAIDPTTTTTLYAGTADGVFKSTNSGTAWSGSSTGLSNTDLRALAIDPSTSSTLYAGTADGMFKSTNSGTTWSASSTGLSASDVRALAIDPSSTSTLYAGTSNGVFKSTNSGGSWAAANSGLTTTDLQSLAIDPSTPATLYAGTFFGGVFKSTNSASSWSASSTGLGNTDVRALAVDPTTTSTLYAGTGGGVYKSTNSGGTWSAFNTGLSNTEVRALAVDPSVPSTVYAGTDGGVFKSTDSGATWMESSDGLLATDLRTLAVDPVDSSKVYAATNSAGVFASSDGGDTWDLAIIGLDDLQSQALVLDPTNPERLYFGGNSGGMFKSGNAGGRWVQDVGGLTSLDVRSLVIDPASPLTLYAGTGGGGVFALTQTEVGLSITKDDGLSSVSPGGMVTYTITVSNSGTADVAGALVEDELPDDFEIDGTGWVCTPFSNSGGTATASCPTEAIGEDLANTVDLPVGTSVELVVSGTVAIDAVSGLLNEAVVETPSGTLDPDVSDNAATDFDLLEPETDLAISKSHAEPVVAGGPVTYTIAVSNNGPLDVEGATVSDGFPAEVSAVTWTCAAIDGAACGNDAGSGDINETIDIPVGGTVTYTATGTVSSAATEVSNTAEVSSITGGVSDSDTSNDESTDTFNPTLEADLSISKDDGLVSVAPGTHLVDTSLRALALRSDNTDTLLAGSDGAGLFRTLDAGVEWQTVNQGISNDEISAVAIDPVSPDLHYAGTGSGSLFKSTDGGDSWREQSEDLDGNGIRALVIDPTDSNLLYAGTAGGVFVSSDGGSNWSASNTGLGSTDVADLAIDPVTTSTLYAATDLGIFQSTDSATSWSEVSNGLSDIDVKALAIAESDPSTLYAGTESGVFQSTDSGSNWSAASTGITNLSIRALAVDPTDASRVYAGSFGSGVFATSDGGSNWDESSTGLSNQFVRQLLVDPTTPTTVWAATDGGSSRGGVFRSSDSGSTWESRRGGVVYQIVASNAGPSDVQGATVSDTFPAELDCEWSCLATEGSSCNEGPTTGDLSDNTLDLLAGGSATYRAVCDLVAETAAGTLSNTATISAPVGVSDGDGSNNSSTDNTTIAPAADLWITKDDGQTSASPGDELVYTLSVWNFGPSDAPGASVEDLFPAELSCEWTCETSVGADIASSCSAGPVTGDLVDAADLPAGGGVTYSATCTVASSASGTVDNTATVSPPAGTSDPDSTNNADTDSDTLAAEADLAISKDDGVDNAAPGGTVTYTIEVSNLGPSDVSDAQVLDTFPSVLSCSTTCAASTGASCDAGPVSGDLDDFVDLPAGGTVTYSAVCTVDSSATGTLENTATVSAPAGVLDPDTSNDSDTDTDSLSLEGDLSITKSDGQISARPGDTVTYTVEVSNSGPSAVTGATVGDDLPDILLSPQWSCVASVGSSCTASGSGDLTDSVDLLAGGSATYTIVATLDPAATGTLENTATVSAPVDFSDPNSTNNSATDSDTLVPTADLAVVKDNGDDMVTAGAGVIYSVQVNNNGPSDASGAVVSDLMPDELSGVTWTCTASLGASCTTSGSNDIADTVNLPAGSSLLYTITATVDSSARGTLANTATVSAPAGVTDDDSSNNSSTDEDTVLAEADLSITKDDGQIFAEAGQELTYNLVVSNDGPLDVVGATVTDLFPAELESVSWTCFAAVGASCTSGPVSGDLVDTVDLTVGSSVVYTATGTVASSAVGTLENTATVELPADMSDPDPSNNSATDIDQLGEGADLSLSLDDGEDIAVLGLSLTYEVIASNGGPGDVTGARVISDLDEGLSDPSWTCIAADGASCAAAGSGHLNEEVDLPVGGTVTFFLTATLPVDASGPIVSSAQVTPPGEVLDPDSANNEDSDSTDVQAGTDLAISKSDGKTALSEGEPIVYTVTVDNEGPGEALGARVTDFFPAELEGCSWTCEASGNGSCSSGPVIGDVDDLVELAAGEHAVYTVLCSVVSGTETVTNTAEVEVPDGVLELEPEDNTASDTTLIAIFADDFELGDLSRWESAQGATLAVPLAQPEAQASLSFTLGQATLERLQHGAALLVVGRSLDAAGPSDLLTFRALRLGQSLWGRLAVRLDDGSWQLGQWDLLGELDIGNPSDLLAGPLEISWRRSAIPDLDDGELWLSINGALRLWLSGLDNDLQMLDGFDVYSLQDLSSVPAARGAQP